jgi:chromosome segregation ATPase
VGTSMSKDSDLYGEDILLWSERQGVLLRRLAAGEAVGDQVDWLHVVDEIEHSHAQRPGSQDEIAQLRARLSAAEALVKELRARLDDLTGKLTESQHQLATAQDQVEAANVRATAAGQAEHAIRRADTERRAKGLLARLKDAWHGQ